MTPEELESVKQVAQQAAQAAAQAAASQAASQAAQQVAEQVAQSVSQAVQKFMQTTGSVTAQSEVGDVGGTEAHEVGLNAFTQTVNANIKRTYDEYQHESLESIRRNRSYVDKVLSDAQASDNRTKQIAEQALQNSVETANMVAKRGLDHWDGANDRYWNVDEVSTLTAKTGVQQDIVAASAAAATAAVLAALAKQAEAKTA